jgi:GDP-L-fucose synthase
VDLFNLDETSKFIEKNRPDVVINAAAKVGGIVANNTQRLEFILENLKINMNILEACIPFNQIKIINLGSSCIYPLNSENPIRESLIMSGKLEPTNSPYAMAKLTAIEIGDALSRQLGHEVINLMPTNLYGPNDNFHPLNSHVIPGLINRFHNSKLNNESEISIWGDGSPLREFLYVDDLADAIKFIIQNKISDNLINVGSSMEISISKLASLIAETVQYNGSIVYDTTKPNGNNRKLLDNSLINSYGWKAKTTLEAGLRLTYDWYLKNIDSLRS